MAEKRGILRVIISIQKMTPPKSDYFVYVSTTPERARWGVEVLGCGFARVAPRQPYPEQEHPSDHYFDFKNGRTLQALQILFIAEGSGWFQTESRQRQRISAESLVFLLPGVWHSYRPDPKTGWEEHWVELDGWVVRRLIEEGVINIRQCVFQGVESSGIAELFKKLHALLTGRRQYTVPELANTAHELLGVSALPPIFRQRMPSSLGVASTGNRSSSGCSHLLASIGLVIAHIVYSPPFRILAHSGPNPVSTDSGTVNVRPHRPHFPQWQTRTIAGRSAFFDNRCRSQSIALALGAVGAIADRRPCR
jgi:hypothetical protein